MAAGDSAPRQPSEAINGEFPLKTAGAEAEKAGELSGAQAREARLLLGLSLSRVSQLCKLPMGVVRRFEITDRMPPSMFRPHDVDRVGVLKDVLEDAGVEFTGERGDAPGVRLRRPIAA